MRRLRPTQRPSPRRRRLPRPEPGTGEPLAVALAALNRREHSIAEIEGKLTERGFDAERVEAVVTELVETGALDDERFARAFSTDKRELHGWGPERIAGALSERGISASLVEECCGSEDRDGLIERARSLLTERGAPLTDDRERSRALGFLTRKGFEYEVAYDAIRAARTE
jgi:regulatory protein